VLSPTRMELVPLQPTTALTPLTHHVPEEHLAAGHMAGVREMELATVLSLARAIEARDMHTGSHIERVQRYSVELAQRLGLDDEDVWRVGIGAILHDVGKIGVPDAVLNKRASLTPRELEEMRRHPTIGGRLLADNPLLEAARDAVLYHHERWDGTGYPNGLAGHSIPIDGRIVAVADAFDAMTANRPYRACLSLEHATDEIARGAGTQFDPEVVRAFLALPLARPAQRFRRIATVTSAA
jgi:HD-GYP domain-containing protein (c-di-GMP phosphodiesterase class II)